VQDVDGGAPGNEGTGGAPGKGGGGGTFVKW
jgi:hypothetical protein